MDYDAQSLFLQKKGFFGPLILTAFLGIFGIIWIIFRALGNSNIDQQINFAFTNIKNDEEKKEIYNQLLQNNQRCKKETIHGVIAFILIWITILILWAVLFILLVVL